MHCPARSRKGLQVPDPVLPPQVLAYPEFTERFLIMHQECQARAERMKSAVTKDRALGSGPQQASGKVCVLSAQADVDHAGRGPCHERQGGGLLPHLSRHPCTVHTLYCLCVMCFTVACAVPVCMPSGSCHLAQMQSLWYAW